MPRPRYARLPNDVRDHILAVAEAEFADKGFHEASYNEIIRASGLSKGSFYHTFEDKEDLFLTVLGERMMRAWSSVDAALPTSDWWGWVERIARDLEAIAVQDGPMTALAMALYQLRSDRAAAFLAQATGWVEAAIVHGQAMGEVRTDLPSDLLARLAMAVGETVDRHYVNTDLAMLPETVEEGHQLVMDLMRRLLEPR